MSGEDTSERMALVRSLHARSTGDVVGLTGCTISSGDPVLPLSIVGLPVHLDPDMPNDVMEMRDADSGEVLRRWVRLSPDGPIYSFDMRAVRAMLDAPIFPTTPEVQP